MSIFKKHIRLIFIFLIVACSVHAQVLVQVASQTIEKKIDAGTGLTVVINAENADLFCSKTGGNIINIEITLISKNEDKIQAETDLKKMKWLVDKTGTKLFIRNYIELGRNESRPESSLRVVYHISLPNNCTLDIHNYFGKTVITNLNNSLKINSEYGNTDLIDVGNSCKITSLFGTINVNRFSGNMEINSNRTDISIDEFSGSLLINATLATIGLANFREIDSVNIRGQKSAIDFKTKNFSRFSYKFDLSGTTLDLPGKMSLDYQLNEKDSIKALFNAGIPLPLIDFDLQLSSIKIENEN